MTTPNAPAGWYDDGSGRQRWFDGTQWTDQYAPVQAAPQPTGTSMSTTSEISADNKVGDIVNGHRLTERPDGSLAWLPVEAAAPAKTSKRALWITLGAVGGVLLLIIIVGSVNRPSNDPAPAAATTAASEAPAEEVEEEPAKVAVPDVTGLPASTAIAILRSAGFDVSDAEDPDATVTGTTPAKGGIAEQGSAVTLTVEVKPKLTLAQSNAIGKAESYLALAGFSRTGLINQLAFEGFSAEDATFAVDTIAPDWNTEAAEKAKAYLELTSFSREGLYDQLIFEGFSDAEANAGLAVVGY